jgi:hypothetical protein
MPISNMTYVQFLASSKTGRRARAVTFRHEKRSISEEEGCIMLKVIGEDGKEILCYTPSEAEAVIARNSGRDRLPVGYLNQLIRRRHLTPVKVNDRLNAYPVEQVDKIRVADSSKGRKGIGGRPRSDTPTPGALRKRKHDARKRQAPPGGALSLSLV